MMLMSRFRPNYCRALVIVHGASEFQIASYIKRNLRLPMEIIGKDNGKHNIQINGLKDYLKKQFPTQKVFLDKANAKVENKKIADIKVFTIMDTDDCAPPSLCKKYKDKSLFNGIWLQPYIFPIYNSPSLEHILYKAKIIDKMLSDDEKMREYRRIFPLDKKNSGQGGLDEIEAFCKKISDVKNTNLNEFVDFCIKWAISMRVKNVNQ